MMQSDAKRAYSSLMPRSSGRDLASPCAYDTVFERLPSWLMQKSSLPYPFRAMASMTSLMSGKSANAS